MNRNDLSTQSHSEVESQHTTSESPSYDEESQRSTTHTSSSGSDETKDVQTKESYDDNDEELKPLPSKSPWSAAKPVYLTDPTKFPKRKGWKPPSDDNEDTYNKDDESEDDNEDNKNVDEREDDDSRTEDGGKTSKNNNDDHKDSGSFEDSTNDVSPSPSPSSRYDNPDLWSDEGIGSIGRVGLQSIQKSQSTNRKIVHAFKKTTKDDYEEHFLRSKRGRAFFVLLWLGVTSLMSYYIYVTYTQYYNASVHPATTVTYDDEPHLPLPYVVICNWNSDPDILEDDPRNATDSTCTYCNLTLVSCLNLYDQSDCSGYWEPFTIKTVEGLFFCKTFNSNSSDVIYSNQTGYSGSYTTMWTIPLIPDDPLITAPSPLSPRFGLQVSFLPQERLTPYMIYTENRYAQVGDDTYFSFIMNFVDDISFSTKSSRVNLINAWKPTRINATTGYIAITFSYEIISIQTIDDYIVYSFLSFVGDVACK
eukprot:TRINITY_DN3838_c0_g1_i4.p1 TRINITY_DN3838_c0_g1~~TRINITY_DN3838_c0_g1_i4.p1  ORF type:complete len:478 (+),score=91.82 TRINITY_DN3838_c0_g1_i4:53-1486(+)